MTRDEVLSNVQDIFRDIFDEKDLIIENGTTSNDIEGWDSLNHIGIISAAEKEFRIKFALGELSTLKDVGSMIDLIIEKLNSV
jgi:acyl carrier protein